MILPEKIMRSCYSRLDARSLQQKKMPISWSMPLGKEVNWRFKHLGLTLYLCKKNFFVSFLTCAYPRIKPGIISFPSRKWKIFLCPTSRCLNIILWMCTRFYKNKLFGNPQRSSRAESPWSGVKQSRGNAGVRRNSVKKNNQLWVETRCSHRHSRQF